MLPNEPDAVDVEITLTEPAGGFEENAALLDAVKAEVPTVLRVSGWNLQPPMAGELDLAVQVVLMGAGLAFAKRFME